jgi:hypothetical protein
MTGFPKAVYLYGSNDNSNWTILKNFTTGSKTLGASHTESIHYTGGAFKYFALVINSIHVSGTDVGFTSIGQIELFGTEEGDTSVDVVHRSIPNTPGQQQLAVYWDANDSASYSFADSSNVYDLSGSGVKGTLNASGGFDSTYNAFTSSGSTPTAITATTSFTGSPAMSFSMWVKFDSFASIESIVYLLGQSNTNNSMVWFGPKDSGSQWIVANGGSGARYNYASAKTRPTLNTWIHVTVTYAGGTTYPTGITLYLNGSMESPSASAGSSTLTLPSNSPLYLGFYSSANSFFDGSIANARIYGKVLNADQVRELYDYDAERFGHRQNLVALHKGNLGVGVAHPTARFEVAGADGLQEYPPKAMTGDETYIEGHGVFRASVSSVYGSGNFAWAAFYEIGTHWLSSSNAFDGGADTFNSINGPWVNIILPHKIKLNYIQFHPRSGLNSQRITDGTVYASNDNLSWVPIGKLNNLGDYTTSSPARVVFSHDTYYNSYLLHITQNVTNYVSIEKLRLFGTPAPSSLEDGHLTLGKALTLPRVSGHGAGAETPRADSLVVHYDTTVDSVVSGTSVVDISGNGINGTLTGGAAYSSTDRALTFDGVDDYVSGRLNNPSGAWVHSISFWMKPSQDQSTMGTTYEDVFQIGNTAANGKYSAFEYYNNFAQWYWYGTAVSFSGNIFSANKWVYITLVTNATTASIYLDGALKTSGSPFTSISLNLDANASLYIGKDGTRNRAPWGGSISNFKLWNVALTAEEVAQEYALGRTGKSLNLTDTALCLGGTVPRAQLDVRGGARFEGGVDVSGILTSYTKPYTAAYPVSTLSPDVWAVAGESTARVGGGGISYTSGVSIKYLNGVPMWFFGGRDESVDILNTISSTTNTWTVALAIAKKPESDGILFTQLPSATSDSTNHYVAQSNGYIGGDEFPPSGNGWVVTSEGRIMIPGESVILVKKSGTGTNQVELFVNGSSMGTATSPETYNSATSTRIRLGQRGRYSGHAEQTPLHIGIAAVAVWDSAISDGNIRKYITYQSLTDPQ